MSSQRFILFSSFHLGGGAGKARQGQSHTLQKSMDFTPLEPRAGPTGGEGEAWPAPTMSLTIWSVWIALRAMVVYWCV